MFPCHCRPSLSKLLSLASSLCPSWRQRLPSSSCWSQKQRGLRAFPSKGSLVAYNPHRHQGMTLRCRRSRHPRASSPLDRRRRRMPSFTTPSEVFISPRHISPGSRARGVIFSVFSFIMNFISPHVFKQAFAYLLLSLLGFRVGSSLFRDPIREAHSLCGPLFFYEYF